MTNSGLQRRIARLHRALPAWLLVAALGSGCASVSLPSAPTRLGLEATPPASAPAVQEQVQEGPGPQAEAQSMPAAEPQSTIPGVAQATVRRARLDPVDDAARGDLWQRLRDGFGLADVDGDLVRKWEQFYAGQPDYVERMTARASRYLFHVLEEVEKRQMPSELALLPFIESAFNPQAMSRARASGMWQFMPATGKDFELRQNVFRDDRRDVLASTRAALDYLQRLNAMFGDWQLALAAYNWGQGNVQKALATNRRLGLPTTYADLRMPDETRNYLPKLQAIKNIVLRPEAYALVLPALDNHPFFQTVEVVKDIDVALAARLSGLTLDEFQQLNPQLNKPVIVAAGTPKLLLPYDNANRFVRELALHQGALASWTAWVAPRTLKPAEVARLTGMPETALREINLIPPRMLVKLGSTLLVPRPAHATDDVDGRIAEHGSMSLAPDVPPLRRISFKAGRHGESVVAVAQRYHVAADEVARWNRVAPQARFKAGQLIVLMVPHAPAPPLREAAPLRTATLSPGKAPHKPPLRAAARVVAAAAVAAKGHTGPAPVKRSKTTLVRQRTRVAAAG